MITENENIYYRFNFKKATNLGKLYLLPMIHKGISKVPGRPVISNCGTTAEKVSEFLLISFLKTTCLSSILSFRNKYQQRLLERRLPLHMPLSLWAALKRNI